MSNAAAREIAVVIPTWNRSDVAMQAIDAVLAQDAENVSLHLIVVDNASSDDTFATVWKRFPDADTVTNRSMSSRRIDLLISCAKQPFQSNGKLASVTLVGNTANLGGSGGFNAGMAVARDVVCKGSPPFALWLLDDDACPPPDALRHLIAALDSDPNIGLAGSRSVDPRDGPTTGETTLETTVYFHPSTGHLGNHPEPNDPRRATHDAWVKSFGDCIGKHTYSGIVDTDVCAACSVLARWHAFLKVGLWDHRFFIYEDDVDFSLRFAEAGYRVVCALDARVMHLTWHQKLTPTLIAQRLFYVQRNRTWLLSRHPDPRARATVKDWLRTTLHHGIIAALHRRGVHGDMLLNAADAVVNNTGGKLSPWPGSPVPLAKALAETGLINPTCRVAVVCDRPGFTRASAALREQFITHRGGSSGLTWIDCVPSDLQEPTTTGVQRLIYSRSLRSRLLRQWPFVLNEPEIVVIFDQAGDFPIMRGSITLHCSSTDLSSGWVEHHSFWDRLAAIRRWWSLRRQIPAYLRTVAAGPAIEPTVTVSATPWRSQPISIAHIPSPL